MTEIENNKYRFINLIKSIEREGADIPYLIRQLTESDFFEAPASAKYHGAEVGGLCAHSLNVYDNLVKINETLKANLDETSMKIVALLHDFSKMNYYTVEYRNKKVYSDDGSKYDENGRYDWVSVPGYNVRPIENRFVFGNHEENSMFMANTFIPLTIEEQVAIMHHHGGMGYDSVKEVTPDVYTRYPLAMFLHFADCVDSYGHTPVEEVEDEQVSKTAT